MQNFKLTIFKTGIDDTMVNGSGTLLVDLKKISMTFIIKTKSSPEKRDYDKLLFQGNVDTCKISQGVIGNFIIKRIMTSALDTNFHFDCPIKKGVYFLYNLPSMPTSFIPAFIPKYNRTWELTLSAKTKLPKVASVLQLLFLKLYGETCID